MTRALLALLFVLSAAPVAADIYKWTDKDGVVHYSDDAAVQGKAQKVEVRINTYTHVTYQKLAPGAATGSRRVVMYGTSWCGYCKKARAHFLAHNIAFTDLDVEADATAKQQFNALGGGGVPVILVGDTRINGFDAAAFDRIYNRK